MTKNIEYKTNYDISRNKLTLTDKVLCLPKELEPPINIQMKHINDRMRSKITNNFSQNNMSYPLSHFAIASQRTDPHHII